VVWQGSAGDRSPYADFGFAEFVARRVLAAGVGMGVKRYREFHGRLRAGWREFPLHHGFLRAFRENGIAAKDLGISHGAVRCAENS